jgi:microcystin-dependent protein
MPVSYTKSGGQGHVYQVPDYPETADGPKAFKDFADFLDLILPPVGTIMPYVGNTAPTGWLLCQGQAVSSATYPKLAVECGTKFGTAPAGQFRLPDLKGRVIAGLDSSQTEFDAIGKTGGAKSVTLTVSNMPAHTHTTPDHTHTASTSGLSASSAGDHSHTASTDTTGAHFHNTGLFVAENTSATGGASRITPNTSNITTSANSSNAGAHSHIVTVDSGGAHTHAITGNITINSSGASNTGSTGSGAAVNTMNPYITMNHIIRAA